MSTLVVCTDCKRKLKVREESLGKTMQCPSCQSRFVAHAAEDSSDTPPSKPHGVVRAEGAGRGSGRSSREEDAGPIRGGKVSSSRKDKEARRARDEAAPRSNKGLLIGLIAGGALLLIGLTCGGAALLFVLVLKDKSAEGVATNQPATPVAVVFQPPPINPRPNNPVPPRRAPSPSSFIIAHGLPVKHMLLNPAGTVIASADQQMLKLWDPFVKDHKPLAQFTFLRDPVNALAFAADGKQLAVGRGTAPIELRDGRTGEQLATPPIRLTRGTDPKGAAIPGSRLTRCLAFSPKGKVLAVGMEGGEAYLWDTDAGKQLRLFKAHAEAVQAIAYCSDGKTLATAGRDNLVKLWDTDTWAERFVLRGHTKGVQALSFTSDGTRLASAGADAAVFVWDVAAGAEKGRLTGHTGAVLSVAYSPDGKLLATGSADSTLRLWDAQTFAERSLIRHGGNSSVEAVAFHPDGPILFSTYSGMIQHWDLPKLLGP